MSSPIQNKWLHRSACALVVATLFLVALGGVVTTKGVGMAVPDWPRTYGEHMFLFPVSKWVGGVFYEHSHRLWASLVGLLTALLAVWTWRRETSGRTRRNGTVALVAGILLTGGLMGVRTPWMFASLAGVAVIAIVVAVWRVAKGARGLRWLMVIAFALVLIQGVMGGLRVALDSVGLGTPLGIFHGALAQLFLLLVGTVALLTSNWWAAAQNNPSGDATMRRVLVGVTVLIFLQLILGASMRHQHAGLAVPDFPLAYGRLWPAIDAGSVATYNAHRMEAAGEHPITAAHIILHMLHRITAMLIVVAVVCAAWLTFRRFPGGSAMRKLGLVWLGLVLVQVTLGAFTVWSQRKVDVTTAHVAVGAATFLHGWLMFLACTRRSMAQGETGRAGHSFPSRQNQFQHA